ncbi:MAG: cation diffusion facilitator family transporter [Eubacteriales bacterium]|nr:cation diffusion facilitator family transporter [Eubacteriales bacterium]
MHERDRNNTQSADRDAVIIRASMIGIAVNMVLAGVKAAVGLASHSIAVVLDAVNNLSDALSSVITILGAKLSGKQPDKKHPMGYGRVEYLSATVVAALVIYAGIAALYESAVRIIIPETSEYTAVSVIMIGLAVAVKLLLGRYVKRRGEAVGSDSLRASGTDALSDAVLSASVLACALIKTLTRISLEAYIGVIISVFIIRSGVGIIRETISEIIGQRTDTELSQKVKELICQEDGVFGAYDLFLNNYGPDRYYGSVNIEVADSATAAQIDQMSRHIKGRVYWKAGVTLTGIGIYSRNTTDAEAVRLREEIEKSVMSRNEVLQVYGFDISADMQEIQFYVVFDFGLDYKTELAKITEYLETLYPKIRFRLAPHVDISD